VYNLNPGHNSEILERSKSLNDYSLFVAKVREAAEGGATLDEAIERGIAYCVERDINEDIFGSA
jgi:hypothetical protein